MGEDLGVVFDDVDVRETFVSARQMALFALEDRGQFVLKKGNRSGTATRAMREKTLPSDIIRDDSSV